MKPILVFAGHFSQYQSFLREHSLSPNQYRYVDRPDQLMGMSDVEYIKVGEWWLNKLYDEGQSLIQAYNLKETTFTKEKLP